MKSTVSCRGHRWLENDKTAFVGTESPAGTCGRAGHGGTEHKGTTTALRSLKFSRSSSGCAGVRAWDGVGMESSEELFPAWLLLVNIPVNDPEPKCGADGHRY